jgi:localization factor PodJL
LAPSEIIEPTTEHLSRGAVELPPATIGPMSLRIAAQQGDPAAAFDVGVRFAEAKGVKQDFQQAVIWYSRAAQKGFVPAQYRLATIYEGGLHGTQDIPRAKVWYKRAADQGHVKAMHNLAVLAAGSNQSQPDYQTASRWFAEAADRGLADSQFNLGVLHESGLGVAKDPLQAFKWFALAARSGDKEALRRRDQIMATFTPQAAQTAERLVQSWRARPTDMKANDPRTAAQAYQDQQARQMQAAQDQVQALQLRQQQQEPAATVAPVQKSAPKPVQRTTASTTPAR